jgi:hypothetical protein
MEWFDLVMAERRLSPLAKRAILMRGGMTYAEAQDKIQEESRLMRERAFIDWEYSWVWPLLLPEKIARRIYQSDPNYFDKLARFRFYWKVLSYGRPRY